MPRRGRRADFCAAPSSSNGIGIGSTFVFVCTRRRRERAIRVAARCDRLDCVLLLLEYSGKRGGCFRAAVEACKHGQVDVAKEMLTRGRWSWYPELRVDRLLRLLEVTSLFDFSVLETVLTHIVEVCDADTKPELWKNVRKVMGRRMYGACTDQRRDLCYISLMACERAGMLPLEDYYCQSLIGRACMWGWTDIARTMLRLSNGKIRLNREMARLARRHEHFATARWIDDVMAHT